MLKADRVEGTLSAQNVGLTSSAGGEEQHLVCQLAKKGAQKRLVIRSRLALRNNLPLPLQVEFAKAVASNVIPVANARHFLPSDPTALADLARDAPAGTASVQPHELIGVGEEFFVSLDDLASNVVGSTGGEEGARLVSWARFRPHDVSASTPYAYTRWFQVRHMLHRAHFVAPGDEIEFVAEGEFLVCHHTPTYQCSLT